MEDFLSVCDGIGAVQEAWTPLRWRPVLLSEIDAFPRAVLKQRHRAVDAKIWLRVPDRDVTVPLWGDFTALRVRHLLRFGVSLPSLLAGGTPCQAFSVAGLRRSLDDARGNLTLSFVRLANAIDNVRRARGLKPLVIVWENVPGVLSVKDNAFGCFLAALVGADAPLVPPGQRGKPGKWSDSGLVAGPKRTAAWAIKDAQYFGLAQRRRRVFVVASAREGFDPSSVLFEPDRLFRDSPPSRQAGQRPAASLTASAGGISGKDAADGRLTADRVHRDGAGDAGSADCAPTLAGGGRRDGGYSLDDIPLAADITTSIDASIGRLQGASGQDLNHGHSTLVAYGGNNTSGPIDVSAALNAHPGGGRRMDFESETFVAVEIQETAHTLRAEGFDASEDGTGRGTPLVPVFRDPQAFNLAPEHGADAEYDLSPTLRAGGHAESHANAGVPPAIAYVEGEPIPFDTTQITSKSNYSRPQAGEPDHPLAAGAHAPAIAFALRGRDDGALPEIHGDGDTSGTLRAAEGGSSRDYIAIPLLEVGKRTGVSTTDSRAGSGIGDAGDAGDAMYTLQAGAQHGVAAFTVSQNADGFAWEGEASATLQARAENPSSNQFNGVREGSAVRRLTPVECERLQGYRDDFTKIEWRGHPAEECPDGPRYKALGNSMAIPVLAWIGFRIENEERRRTGRPLLPTPPAFTQPHYDEHVRDYWRDDLVWEASLECGFDYDGGGAE